MQYLLLVLLFVGCSSVPKYGRIVGKTYIAPVDYTVEQMWAGMIPRGELKHAPAQCILMLQDTTDTNHFSQVLLDSLLWDSLQIGDYYTSRKDS